MDRQGQQRRQDESKKRDREEQRYLDRLQSRPQVRRVITDPVIIELMFLEHINVD